MVGARGVDRGVRAIGVGAVSEWCAPLAQVGKMAGSLQRVPAKPGVRGVDMRVVSALRPPGAVERLVRIERAAVIDTGPLGNLAQIMQERGQGDSRGGFDQIHG